jgi:methanogenic corrinoid protein MtbC1
MASAIARFDERELDRLYDQALSFHPVHRVTQHVLLPLLEEVGERWRTLPGGVAEEHFFGMYMRSKIGARLQHRMRYATGPLLVAGCLPGELHEIGLMLFALEAHEAGLRTVLLGAQTPLEEVAVAQRRTSAAAIVLSSTLDPEPAVLRRELPKLVRKANARVFVGGPTAVRERAAIAAAGAVPCGVDLEDGVRLILATLRDAAAGR